MLAEYASDSTQAPTLSRTYAYGQDLISQVIHLSALNPQASTNYYGYDGHGSVRMLIEGTSAAVVTDTYDYDAYGVLLAITGTTPNHYRYTGEQWDSDLGMYYLRARYYHPETGRFWTRDLYEGTREKPVTLHKYLYCGGNPANRTDPTGLRFQIDDAVQSDFEEAKNYLRKSTTASSLIDKARDDTGNTYHIVKAEGDYLYSPDWSNFEEEPAVIHWAPRVALRLNSSGEVLSPALALVHELGHCYFGLVLRYVDKKENQNKTMEFERTCVSELRANGENEAWRNTHRDPSECYYVPSPSKRGPLGQRWHAKPALSREQMLKIVTNRGPLNFSRLVDFAF